MWLYINTVFNTINKYKGTFITAFLAVMLSPISYNYISSLILKYWKATRTTSERSVQGELKHQTNILENFIRDTEEELKYQTYLLEKLLERN